MQIEELTAEKAAALSDQDLHSLRFRAAQIYQKHFINKGTQIDLSEDELLERYGFIAAEMKKRGTKVISREIDMALFRKAVERISKPETTENYHHVPVTECKITATISIDEKSGIKALYCGGEKQIATYLFDRDKWTMAEARAWVEEHKSVSKSVGGSRDLPLSDSLSWDANAAISAMRRLAGGPAKEDIDWSRYQRGFVWYDASDKENFTSYKLPFATVIDGKLTAVWGGVYRAMAAVLGARGGVDLGGDERAAYSFLTGYYKRFDKEVPEFRKYAEAELEKMFAETAVEKMLLDKVIPIFDISKSEEEHIVAGIVYEPNAEDTQGDYTTEDEIRKAAYSFMEEAQRYKVNHKGKEVKANVLESYIAPQDLEMVGNKIKKGSWILISRVLDEEIWRLIKAGELQGLSMAGTATV